MAEEAEIRAAMGASAGSLGPVGANVPVIVDYAAAHIADFAAGANEDDYHYFNINWERDVPLGKVADLRNIVEGDPAPDGSGTLAIRRGIEVGHIFQLGKKYSEAMGLKVQLEDGGSAIPLMGCYGIGVTRVVAAAIEQNHDERGIIWPQAIAPFTVAILPLNAAKSPEVMVAAEALYQKLLAAGVDVSSMTAANAPASCSPTWTSSASQRASSFSDKTPGEWRSRIQRTPQRQRRNGCAGRHLRPPDRVALKRQNHPRREPQASRLFYERDPPCPNPAPP